MDLASVRDAYAARAQEYLGLFDGDWQDPDEAALVRRHLTGLAGPVLDLGCGPGHWSAWLHALGADVTGVDMVPAFLAQARALHAGPAFRLGLLTDPVVPDSTAAGVLSWYSTVHLPPAELPPVLAGFRRLLVPGGVLVLGFFDSDDDVAPFDHAVVTAWRRPVDVVAGLLAEAGFHEVERLQRQTPERPDRRYAAVAARTA